MDMDEILQVMKDKLDTVDIDGTTYWIMEGDFLLDEAELEQYAFEWAAREEAVNALSNANVPPPAAFADELVGMNFGNGNVRWEPGLELSYCVLKDTFVRDGGAGYDLVVDAMQKATADWEKTCGVKFVYRPELDESDELLPEGVLFAVREFNAGGRFIASAFFPYSPKNRRRVLIDPSYYNENLSFDRVGVLRHELGHVLGFRHEHIRPDAPTGCPDEELFGVVDLTDYDPNSVMHYLCGGLGEAQLKLTPKDKAGSQKLYGPPLDDFEFYS